MRKVVAQKLKSLSYNLTYIICILHNNSAISSVHSKQSWQHKMFLKFFILAILTQISLGHHKSKCRQNPNTKKCQKQYGSIDCRIKSLKLTRKEIDGYPFLKSYGLEIRKNKIEILTSIDPVYILVESEKNALKTTSVEDNNIAMSTVFPHIVAAATILFWIHKSLNISYSFLIKFSLM